MSGRQQPPAIVLCELPAATINRTIATDLEAGEVILTRAAQIHASRRHPSEYPICFPHLAAVVEDPLYIGDDFDNEGIELIGRIPGDGRFMLVAVNVTVNEHGQYEIASFYIVSEKKIQGRRAKGFLRVALKA